MTIKRALGLMMLVLLACGSGVDEPASHPGGSAEKSAKTLRGRFVWGDESRPAHDWDVDAAECEKRADQDPSVRRGAHALVKVGVFMECMKGMGWEEKG